MPMDEERDRIQTEMDRQDESQERSCVCVLVCVRVRACVTVAVLLGVFVCKWAHQNSYYFQVPSTGRHASGLRVR